MAGEYLAHCNCRLVCPCAVDGPPTAPGGNCNGLLAVSVREGNLDDLDLAGVNLALSFDIPSNLSAGDWTIGAWVDEGASDEQAEAVERILSGKVGGPFGEFSALYGEWLGVQRASVSFSDGEAPSATVGDTNMTFEALRTPDGAVTKMKDAAFGFAPEFILGKSSGRSVTLNGKEFDAVYGEASSFEWAS
jgi:hypothetical protein